MTAAQVAQLAAEGFTIGAHTASHARLARPRQSTCNVTSSNLCRDTLEGWTGQRSMSLAYPLGQPRRDYNDETLASAGERSAFAAAFTHPRRFCRSTSRRSSARASWCSPP